MTTCTESTEIESQTDRKSPIVTSPVSKVKKNGGSSKNCPNTPEEECKWRQVNVQLCDINTCPLSQSPKGASYEAAMRIKAAHASHVTKRKLVDEFNLEESNAKVERSNSSEASKYHSLITVKSEPDESTSPVIDIVSPKETTPNKSSNCENSRKT